MFYAACFSLSLVSPDLSRASVPLALFSFCRPDSLFTQCFLKLPEGFLAFFIFLRASRMSVSSFPSLS
jgi:hypothetical protein